MLGIFLYFVLMFVCQVICRAGFNCSGLSPGYYADISTSCRSYLLCMVGSSRTRGMLFSCPQGTKFQQRTLVCDHAHSVNCQDSTKYFKNNHKIWQNNQDLDNIQEHHTTKKDES